MPRVVTCRVLIKDKKEIYIAAGKKSCPITEAVYFLKYIRQFNLLFGSLSGVGRYCVYVCAGRVPVFTLPQPGVEGS